MAHNQYHNTTSENDNIDARTTRVESKINSFEMNLSNLGSNIESRSFTIKGDAGANFSINVVQESSSSSVQDKFYNWKTNLFASEFNSNNTLKVKMTSKVFNGNISFPAENNGDYKIIIFALEGSNTTFSPSTGAVSKNILTKVITQVQDSTLTLSPASASGSSYQTFPTTTRVASITSTETAILDIDWTINNTNSDSNGFGLRDTTLASSGVLGKVNTNSWYFETTKTIDGAVIESQKMVLNNTTDLVEGMVIVSVTDGGLPGLSGEPQIIQISGNSIKISTTQTFADGATLTFRAKGATVTSIPDLDIGIKFSALAMTTTTLKKTVRTNPSGTTVDLNGTYGIAGGGHVTISGLNVNNDGTNTVQSVSASSTAGSIVMQLDQTGVTTGTELTFTGSVQQVRIVGTVQVTKQPSSNRTINLNLDDILTVGAAS